MLFLRTGLPGAGKTLNAIREIDIEHQRHPDNPDRRLYADPDNPELPPRTIYYYGIPNLKVDKLKSNWVEFEAPDKWFDLPDGSVIVVDEAQQFFGNDGSRARPEKFSRFETHRHQGLDIHLITQHPSLLSPHVRKLVGKHINFIRPYGREKGIFRHEYEFCIDSPEKRAYFKQAQEEKVSLDPAYFGVYKSSTIHTHKPTTPKYWKTLWIAGAFIVLCVAVLIGLGVFMTKKMTPDLDPGAEPVEQTEVKGGSTAGGTVATAQAKDTSPDPEAERVAWMQNYQPRLDNLQYTAPRYDELNVPKDIPRLHCTMSTDERVVDRFRKVGQVDTIDGTETACQCYTQQGTRSRTTVAFCVDAVVNGIFDDTRQQRQLATPAGMSSESAVLRRGSAASAAPMSTLTGYSNSQHDITVVGGGKPGHLW